MTDPEANDIHLRMIWIGTSGFQYPEWKGKFYPEKFSPKKMLAFYSERFNSTESNYTFRAMPTEAILINWASQTPKEFRFTLKAPKQITHFRKLRDCEAMVRQFADVSQALGSKLGAVLFQLDPAFQCDVPLLRDFLAVVPTNIKGAFEFRHDSWFNDEVYSALRAANCAFCVGDSEKIRPPVIHTAQHAYFRLRDEKYTDIDLKKWSKEIRAAAQSATDVYVYFKHEESGTGPEFAMKLVKLLRD